MTVAHGFRHPAPGEHTPVTSRFNKTRRSYGDPVAAPAAHPRFIVPPPTSRNNLVLPLDVVLRDPGERARLAGASKLVFHCVGDTGGINGTDAQEAVAHAMETQIQTDRPEDRPSFFYHLGDVIYFNGLERMYSTQFYEPYKYYPAPIFAIPGNHDGDTSTRRGDEPDHEPSLTGFMVNFCAPQAEYDDKYRETMTQPYVYWTLEAPFVTVIGLYSNVDGTLDGRGSNEQQRWFEQQLAAAPKDKWVLVAVHHPPYSLDADHGGSPDILAAVERAAAFAKRWPDVVLSGHVHNYQRFTRKVGSQSIPFLVAGAGGYANTQKKMHQLQLNKQGHTFPTKKPFPTTKDGVTLEHYEQTRPGFLRLTVDDSTFKAEYFVVPFDDAPPATPVDTFQLDKRTGQFVTEADEKKG